MFGKQKRIICIPSVLAIFFTSTFFTSTAVFAQQDALRQSDEAREWIERFATESKPIPLSKSTRALIRKQKKITGKNYRDTAVIGEDGSIVYTNSASTHTVVCSPMQITDIIFPKGEFIKDVHVGDNVRWKMSLTTHGGDGPLQSVTHLIVKPIDVNIQTTMLVLTNLRSYRISLISTERDFMPSVTFKYTGSEEDMEKYYREMGAGVRKFVAESKARQPEKKAEAGEMAPKTIPTDSGKMKTVTSNHKRDPSTFDFKYDIDGSSDIRWLPSIVYNNGEKTYIKLSDETKVSDAPVFVSLTNTDKHRLVNYRYKPATNVIVVDMFVRKGLLISGAGRKKQVVKITYDGKKQTAGKRLVTGWKGVLF